MDLLSLSTSDMVRLQLWVSAIILVTHFQGTIVGLLVDLCVLATAVGITPLSHSTRCIGVIVSRFILNLRDLNEVPSADMASSPSQLQTLIFAQRSGLTGSIGLHLEPEPDEAGLHLEPESDEAVHDVETTEDEATQLLLPSLQRANTVASNSSSYSEFAYLKEVRCVFVSLLSVSLTLCAIDVLKGCQCDAPRDPEHPRRLLRMHLDQSSRTYFYPGRGVHVAPDPLWQPAKLLLGAV